jgi:TetR/AcrR family transcriptional regulator, transcriptional repressor for nem operon
MVRYKSDHRAKTQVAIIDAAAMLLRDKGFTETSVGHVMKAVGLTHGGFYAHFPDKTAMLQAAVAQAFTQSPKNFAALAGMAKATGDAGVIAKHYLSETRVEAVATGCPAAALVSELHRQDVSVREVFQDGSVESMEALTALPGLAQPGHETAWAALAMLVGGLSMMRAIPDCAMRDTIRSQIIDGMRQLAATAPDATSLPAAKDNN